MLWILDFLAATLIGLMNLDSFSTLGQLRELVFALSLCLGASGKAYHLQSANAQLIRTSV